MAFDEEYADCELPKRRVDMFHYILAAGAVLSVIVGGALVSRKNSRISELETSLGKERQSHVQDCSEWKAEYDKLRKSYSDQKKENVEFTADVLRRGTDEERSARERLGAYICTKMGLNGILEGAADEFSMWGDVDKKEELVERLRVRDGIKEGYYTVSTHKIVEGDTLSEIAEKYNVPMREIRRLNNLVGNFGDQTQAIDGEYPWENPNLIMKGRHLLIPKLHLEVYRAYDVKKGDRLMDIAEKFLRDRGYDKMVERRMAPSWFQRVVALNRFHRRLDNPDKIKTGDILLLPDPIPLAEKCKAEIKRYEEEEKKWLEEQRRKRAKLEQLRKEAEKEKNSVK